MQRVLVFQGIYLKAFIAAEVAQTLSCHKTPSRLSNNNENIGPDSKMRYCAFVDENLAVTGPYPKSSRAAARMVEVFPVPGGP